MEHRGRRKTPITLRVRLKRLRVAECQFLSGKSVRETAAIFGISRRTVDRWTREAMGFEEGAHLIALAESAAKVRPARGRKP
jgi:transposase